MTTRIASLLVGVINIVLSIIAFFLGLRIILRLFSANPATPFVAWVYNISEFFLSPFRGIFPNMGIETGVLDMVAIIALVGYMLLGYLVIEIFRNIARPSRERVTTTTHYHDIDDDLEDSHRHYR